MRNGLVKKTGVFFRDKAIPTQIPGLLKAIGYDGAKPKKNQPSSFWLREGHRLDEILYDVHAIYRDRAKKLHPDISNKDANQMIRLNQIYGRIKTIIQKKLSPASVVPKDSQWVPNIQQKACACGCGMTSMTTKHKWIFNDKCRKKLRLASWRKCGLKREAAKKIDNQTTLC